MYITLSWRVCWSSGPLSKVAELFESVSKNDEFCIKNEELCIKHEELCIKNEEFCI